MDNRPLKHGIIMTYSAGVVQIVVNMVFTAVLARCLGSVEYGLYLLLGSVVAYISSFDFGLNNTTSRYVAKYRAEGSKEKESNLISITMLFYCIIAGVILIVGLILRGHLSLFVHDVTPEYMSLANKLFLLLIINIAISLPMHSFSAILIGYEKFVYTRIITIIRIVAVPLLSIPFLLLGKGSLAVVAITTVSNLLAGMANLLYAIKKLHVKIKLLYWNSEFVREIIGYSWFIFLGVVADQILLNTGNVVIGMTNSPAAVSAFGIAIQLCNALGAVISTMTGVFLPRITTLVASNFSDRAISDYFIKIGRLQSMLLFLVVGGFFTIGRTFVFFWLGADYAQVYILTCVIFIPLSVILTKTIAVSILQARNIHAFRSKLMLITAVINLVCAYFAAKYLGIVAVALCVAATYGVNSIVLDIFYCRKAKIEIPRYYKSLFPIVISMVLPTLAIGFAFSFQIGSKVLLLAGGVLYVIAYFGLLWVLALRTEEKKQVIQYVRRLNHS